MAVKIEEIKKAKKFLENNKISIKHVKPRLFAIAANGLKKNFDETLEYFMERTDYGKINNSNKKEN
mgnify:CR=1 FL=1|tara:strand:+ start:333 stop:530 length:198 start_codon:yes stop_codon:yes gene_type:complete